MIMPDAAVKPAGASRRPSRGAQPRSRAQRDDCSTRLCTAACCEALGSAQTAISLPGRDAAVVRHAQRTELRIPATKQGQLGFVLLRLARSEDSFDRGTEATDALRALIADRRKPGIRKRKIGLTGLPIMENDEMRSSQTSMFWASLVSLVGVGMLFVAGFGGLRHALLANLVLLVGMAWAFGYVTLVGRALEHPQRHVHGDADRHRHRLRRLLRRPLPAIARRRHRTAKTPCWKRRAAPARRSLTGAMTTAIAFFAAGFTSFTGVAELGIIAGGGILLCARRRAVRAAGGASIWSTAAAGAARCPSRWPVHKWIAPLMQGAAAARWRVHWSATAVCCRLGLDRLWYDNNLLNMQAVGLESVELETQAAGRMQSKRVVRPVDRRQPRRAAGPQGGVSASCPRVERTEEIVSLLPADHEVKQPIIERIQQRLATLPERPPLIPVDRPEKLGQVLAQVQSTAGTRRPRRRARAAARAGPRLAAAHAAGGLLRRCSRSSSSRWPATCSAGCTRCKSIANPEPPQLTDLPASLVDRFVGQHGQHLLKIYGRGNIWDTRRPGAVRQRRAQRRPASRPAIRCRPTKPRWK